MKNLNKRGGKGMLPLGCLPLWGREGVTLMAAAEDKRITGKRGFQQSPFLVFVTKFFIYSIVKTKKLRGWIDTLPKIN
jgi:hypothetical protein